MMPPEEPKPEPAAPEPDGETQSDDPKTQPRREPPPGGGGWWLGLDGNLWAAIAAIIGGCEGALCDHVARISGRAQ